MRKLVLLLLLCSAHAARAQVPITQQPLTPEAAQDIAALYNNPQTNRLMGDSRIATGNDVSANVAVLEGNLTLAGHIKGDLLVVNGDASFEPGAQVDGAVIVLGGTLHSAQNLSAAHVTWYRERLKYELRDGVLEIPRQTAATDELRAGHQFGFGRTDLIVAARGGYNRSEGLPINIGPRVTFGRANTTLLEALYIFRTASAFQFDEQDYGYVLRGEQTLGGNHGLRLGLRYASEVLPVETWGLSDRENSLAAFVLHKDYRDQYNREGWTAYLTSSRTGAAFNWTVEYGNLRFKPAQLRDPYSLRDNPNPWRPEVQFAYAHLDLAGAHARWDTRNEDRDPTTGWLATGDLEIAVASHGTARDFAPHYRYGTIDVRRYARLSPLSRIALRAVAAGSVNGDELPAFRQQALGGPGTLPGYRLYAYDCGAHRFAAELYGEAPYYGCDRLALFQFEYQARFRWLSQIGARIGRDFGLLENIRGVLFFDTGRTWNEGDARGNRINNGTADFVTDAGFGLRFGRLGTYWALPLSERAQGLHFIMRLEPRL